MTVEPWGSKPATVRNTWVGPFITVLEDLLWQIFRTGARLALPHSGFLPEPSWADHEYFFLVPYSYLADIRWHQAPLARLLASLVNLGHSQRLGDAMARHFRKEFNLRTKKRDVVRHRQADTARTWPTVATLSSSKRELALRLTEGFDAVPERQCWIMDELLIT